VREEVQDYPPSPGTGETGSSKQRACQQRRQEDHGQGLRPMTGQPTREAPPEKRATEQGRKKDAGPCTTFPPYTQEMEETGEEETSDRPMPSCADCEAPWRQLQQARPASPRFSARPCNGPDPPQRRCARMPRQAEQAVSALQAACGPANQRSTTCQGASSMDEGAGTDPRTSCQQSVNGLCGTVTPSPAPHSSPTAHMTSSTATKEHTGVASMMTDWRTTRRIEAREDTRGHHRSSQP
jgi:hypothetical protein